MKIVVIGLGYYGKGVAVRLAEVGHEVVCIDNRMGNIESIKDKVSAAFVLDATDFHALSSIPVKEADLCIVAIGEDLGASIRVIALLKKLGAGHIYVRASDPVHRSIVDAFQVDKVFSPEDDSARDFVSQLQFTSEAETFNVAKGFGVFKFPVPGKMVGKAVGDVGLKSKYGLSVICLIKRDQAVNDVGIVAVNSVPDENVTEDTILSEKDILVCYGPDKGFSKFAADTFRR